MFKALSQTQYAKLKQVHHDKNFTYDENLKSVTLKIFRYNFLILRNENHSK
jgi:hypothetical protein